MSTDRERFRQLQADEEELAASYTAALTALRDTLPELRAMLYEDDYHRVAGLIMRVVKTGTAYLRVKDDLVAFVGEVASRRLG